MRRAAFLALGFVALGLGALGAIVPLLPTVPFVILSALCFARSSPALERRLVEHPTLGAHIVAWRERGAISRRGKVAAAAAFAVSALPAVLLVPWPMAVVPLAAICLGSAFVLSRPSA